MLHALLDRTEPHLHHFRIVPATFERAHGRGIADGLPAYGKVFARPILEHRELVKAPEFNTGPEGWRQSSLDRFPLIADDADSTWYVPNVRGLTRTAPDALHFAIDERCRESYRKVRGHLLELYLTKLLGARAPWLVVIPEEKWATDKGEVAGPDLVVIDHGQPLVLGIEVKFRRMMPSTRFELLEEDLTINYGKLWTAIRALPHKLGKVFELPGGYQRHHSDLVRARDYPRICLGLAGEAPFMLGELSRYRATHDSAFPLYGFAEPWAVMTTETFEDMVEVAVQHKRALAEILKEYRDDCAERELSAPMAEAFRDARIDESQTFALTALVGRP